MLLLMYSAVLISLLVMRKTKPDHPRYFTTPAAFIGIPLCILFLMFLLYMWLTHTPGAMHTFTIVLSFIGVGIPVYFLIEMYYNPKTIRKVNDLLAYVTLFTEWFFVPKRIKKEILELLGEIEGKTILEFGCSVGGLTHLLAKAVSVNGKIYASNLSLKELELTQKKMKKHGHDHVRLIHDEQHHSRVHPLIPNVDAVVSIGMLGYVQDMKKVLTELNAKLDTGGKFCFVEYDKFFHLIPNVEWISTDEKLKEFFKQCGYMIQIIRKKGLLWEYVFIYGIKHKKTDYVYI